MTSDNPDAEARCETCGDLIRRADLGERTVAGWEHQYGRESRSPHAAFPAETRIEGQEATAPADLET